MNFFKTFLFSLLFATSSIAQDAPDIEFSDEYNIDRINEDHYIVEYWNSGQLSSVPTAIILIYDPLIVIAMVTPSAGPETFEVIVPLGWIAVPESITVEDGSLGRINIFREQEPPMMS